MQGFNFSSLPLNLSASVVYAYGSNDPSVVATKGTKGQFYLKIPTGELYQKNDNGISTNWSLKTFGGGPSPDISHGIYYVGPSNPYTTIQSAIDQAVLDGHTSALNPATIVVLPKSGGYLEHITFGNGINITTPAPESRNVLLVGGITYNATSSLPYDEVMSSISGFTILDDSSHYMLEYIGSSGGNFIVNSCQFLKRNSTNDMIYSNYDYGSLYFINTSFDSNQNAICLNLEGPNLVITGYIGISNINGGNKAIRFNKASRQANLLGCTINSPTYSSPTNASIDLLGGTLIFSLGGLGAPNTGTNPCGVFVDNGAVMMLFMCSNQVQDNGSNRLVEGNSGGILMNGVVFNFPMTTNKVSPNLTLMTIPEGVVQI